MGVAEHPARTVDVERITGRVPVTPAGLTIRARTLPVGPPDGDPLLVDVRHLDLAGLHLVDGLATLRRGEVEQVRRIGGGLRESGGRRFASTGLTGSMASDMGIS